MRAVPARGSGRAAGIGFESGSTHRDSSSNLTRPDPGAMLSRVIGHYCNCGIYMPTLAGLRRHARKCDRASAKLRAAEDRARIDRIERAKKINVVAREDAWRQLLERP